jgi:Mn-dependent DtxR family transcriptional regulator
MAALTLAVKNRLKAIRNLEQGKVWVKTKDSAKELGDSNRCGGELNQKCFY